MGARSGAVLSSSMVRYIIRRLLWVVVLLVARQLPDVHHLLHACRRPTRRSCAPAVSRTRSSSSRSGENLGLDDPWYQQYFHYMKDLVLHFDLGYSYQNNYPVKDQIFDRLPASISVAIGRAVIWLLLGITIGVISAVRSRTALDRVTMGLALVAISAPVYWLGLVALYLFSNDIGRFHLFMGAGTYVPLSQDPWLWFRVPDHAVVRARRRVRRLLRTAGARQHDRGDVRGLHSHRAREGASRAARDLPPRPAQRDHAGGHRGRPRHRDPARRHDPCRDRLQHSRRRQARLRLDRELATCR